MKKATIEKTKRTAAETYAARLEQFRNELKAAIKAIENGEKNALRVSISRGNVKMHDIQSVSLLPFITCPAAAECKYICYAAKIAMLRPSVRKAWARNTAVLLKRPDLFWQQVRASVAMVKYFRFHVGGDIPGGTIGAEYFTEIIKTAETFPETKILLFTKRFNVVNKAIENGGALPENLQVIFSGWNAEPVKVNIYNLPESNIILRGAEPGDAWKVCGGNCAACACRGVGCWQLKHGETIAFYEH